MNIRLPQDPNAALLAQMGAGIGQGLGGAFKGNQFQSAIQRMLSGGTSLEDVRSNLSTLDPEYADKWYETTLKKQAKIKEEGIAKELAMRLGLPNYDKVGSMTDVITTINAIGGMQQVESEGLGQLFLRRVLGGEDPNIAPEEGVRAITGIPQPAAPKEPTTPTSLREFELSEYGEERPDLRGTEEYRKKRLEYVRSLKEQSPYTDAIIRREASGYRKEFYAQPDVREAIETNRKFEVMREAFKESKETGSFIAVDQALITLFNKMTDPSSVVRESEYARTPGDMALLNRLKGKVAKVQTGGAGLTQEDREAIFEMGKKFQDVTKRRYRDRVSEYKGYLGWLGVDPDEILNPPEMSSIEDLGIPELEQIDPKKAELEERLRRSLGGGL